MNFSIQRKRNSCHFFINMWKSSYLNINFSAHFDKSTFQVFCLVADFVGGNDAVTIKNFVHISNFSLLLFFGHFCLLLSAIIKCLLVYAAKQMEKNCNLFYLFTRIGAHNAALNIMHEIDVNINNNNAYCVLKICWCSYFVCLFYSNATTAAVFFIRFLLSIRFGSISSLINKQTSSSS